MSRRNPFEQFELFGEPSPEPPSPFFDRRPVRDVYTPEELGPDIREDAVDGFLFQRSAEGSQVGWTPQVNHCSFSRSEKEASRARQFDLWASGWRPSGPPRPYRPEPAGTPARVYNEPDQNGKPRGVTRPDLDYDPDVRAFDKIIIQFSGGKDSVACLLYLIELCEAAGINPADRIECWHRCVDGDPRPIRDQRGPDGEPLPVPKQYLFDWPCTEDYVVKVCSHLGIPLLFQWRTGGIMEGVFLRKGDPPGTIAWEEPEPGAPLWAQRSDSSPPPGYRVRCRGGRRPEPGSRPGKPRDVERLMWPLLGKIPQGRWCSAYVKIEVFGSAFRNSARFDNLRVLSVTGERAEESSNRATYVPREFDHLAGHGEERKGANPTVGEMATDLAAIVGQSKSALKKLGKDRLLELWSQETGRAIVGPRYVEGWKPVLDWCEIEVWAIMARHQLRPHPAYEIGFGRLSCAMCIFGSKNQFETIRTTTPQGKRRFETFQRAEAVLGKIQAEAVKKPQNWGNKGADAAKALPTIKYRDEKVGRKKIKVAVPLGEFVDAPEKGSRAGPDYAADIAAELRAGGAPEDVVAYHAGRAMAGLPVAFPASVTQPELSYIAWSEHLPPSWSAVDPRWRQPGYLPAGAFGEDAGPS
jgi:3'-phosphoadenosine 5'-phosphosulfate sulfotransferase (PAPS reductase)/FAD synthetase